eukprot:9924803-Lingulodinium_polyedra.AAC.1
MSHPLAPTPPRPSQRATLWALLHPGLGRWQEHLLTAQQRRNLLYAKARLNQVAVQPSCGPQSLATIQVDRNPETRFGD